MKTNIVKVTITIALATLLSSCGSGSSHSESQTQEQQQEPAPAEISATFKDADAAVKSQLNLLFQHYIHLKNGLVASDAGMAKAGAMGILDALNAVDTTKFTPEQKSTFVAQHESIKEDAAHISDTDDVGHQRDHFGSLSNAIYQLAKAFGSDDVLYYDFCPMAFDNKGAYWLSELKDIRNPYFGDKMLKCGTVKEIIK